MRTLLISDLHLGQRPGHDVLRRPEPLSRLLAALDDIDRLVMLGDVVELSSRTTMRRSMEVARTVLGAIAARMGPDREIVLVPGNHDGSMVREWARQRGGALGLADAVPVDVTPTLEAVTGLLRPARVRVSYPGVWIGDRVWATHGHYLDRHLIPETTFGVLRRWDGRRTRETAAIDYERARRHRRRPSDDSLLSRLRERPLAVALEGLAELTRYATVLLQRIHLTPVTTAVIDAQVRRAAVPAMAEVTRRLGVGADWVVFGHVHRLGPPAGDRWQPAADGPGLLNTGSWLYEPLLLDRASPPHPYWPGGAVIVEDGGPPRAVGLLDGLERERLVGAG